MRLGLHVGYWGLGVSGEDQQTLAREADRLGYDSIWAAEAYGSDAATVMAWLATNTEKAKIIYDILDASSFYKGHARKDSRSLMNITFRSPSEVLDEKFLAGAKSAGLDGLKGHRATGGIRASTYNAMTRAGCEALAQFMREFERTNG